MSWLDHMPRRTVGLIAKRAFDIAASSAGLGVLTPIFAGSVGLVWWKHGWPPLFRQTRPGLKGEPFRLLKLRTMTDERDPSGALLPDAERLTPVGNFLRSSSIDELPALWNVLIGEMSLVGPRPLLMDYLERYDPKQRRRHDMPPGITGWVQVNGRNAISWEEKFELDVWYVDNHSFWLDIKILAQTAATVVRRRGINAKGNTTMPIFTGSMTRERGRA